jgi:hypothetical protein
MCAAKASGVYGGTKGSRAYEYYVHNESSFLLLVVFGRFALRWMVSLKRLSKQRAAALN